MKTSTDFFFLAGGLLGMIISLILIFTEVFFIKKEKEDNFENSIIVQSAMMLNWKEKRKKDLLVDRLFSQNGERISIQGLLS